MATGRHKKMHKNKVPSSTLGRAARLFGAGAAFIGREIAVRSLDVVAKLSPDEKLKKRLEQAQGLVDALSNLKGAAMKTGQLLSLEFSDLLPPEITQILRTLHDSSTFMEFDQVKKILHKELGPERLAELKNISETPISAASIGQVHSAELFGKKVVIKVQFPGVEKSIGADLSLVRKAIESILWMQNKDVPLDGFFEECERILRQEVDYKKELKFIQKYRDLTKDSRMFLVPEVYEEHSSRRVLTLTFMEGERISDWLKNIHTEQEKKDFAELVLELLVLEFFEWGLVQTDPNFGNFLYRPETNQLVLLDFGACNSYSKKNRKDVLALLRSAMDQDDKSLLLTAHQVGVLDPREDDAVKMQFCKMMSLITKVYRASEQPFNFANSEYLTEVRATTLEFAKAVKHTAPAKELIFLNRKLGGMFHLLKDVGARYDLNTVWLRLREL